MVQVVKSFDELMLKVAEIRSLKLGFITNFFPDSVKHGLWIEKGCCHAERINNTLFIIKRNTSFWNVFFCSTTIDFFAKDVETFLQHYPDVTIMFDIVGRDVQCQPFVELFKAKGCHEATSLVRMTRLSAPMDYTPDDSVHYASEMDILQISQNLHQYFDERTEQIPYDEELFDYIRQGHVLVCEKEGQMIGFLVFELNATTIYLRYWFTHPDYRDQKVGSRLLRRFFEEGKKTKRQIFWVIRTNENAILRYRHYGFVEENMFDYVMQYN